MSKNPNKAALLSQGAGQVAMQSLLFVIVNMLIGLHEDRDAASKNVIEMAEGLIDRSPIPNLDAEDLAAVRAAAKFQARTLIEGATVQ